MKSYFLPILIPTLVSLLAASIGQPKAGDTFARIASDHGTNPQDKKQATAQKKELWWGNWRGPDGTCIAPNSNPPTEWSEDKNIRWKVALPGRGSSSPIIWKDRIYLTTAIATEKEGKAPVPAAGGGEDDRGRQGRSGRRGRGGKGGKGKRGFGGPPPTKIHEFVVLALDRKDGSIVWREKVKEAVPHEAGHDTATFASNSPITDGEHIYAYYGSRGLHCLDMKGKLKWSKDFGLMRTSMGFGEGSSPALYGDTLVVNWDHEGESFVVAFDKRSGRELWREKRDERTSWSTPLIVPVDGHPQVIISATGASRSYDLKTGKVLWSCSGLTRNCIPTPIHVDGLVYLMSGYSGNSLQVIRLEGAKGNLEDSDKIVWSRNRDTPYTPSGLVYDGYVYILRSNSGVLSCLDAKTGDVHYQGERLQGMRTIYSSLVGAAGRVYISSREGTTKVIKLGPEFDELASNTLDDGFDATAAIVGDELYLRGQKSLYCIAEK